MGFSTVTSEALQLKLRQLLPSQQGFGTDLTASDTIIPIIDLTQAAEGSEVRADLQSALAFGNNTPFSIANTNSTVISNTGFFRIVGTCASNGASAADLEADISMTDGVTTKSLWGIKVIAGATPRAYSESYDLLFFVNAGESVIITAGNSVSMVGSTRQIADKNGTLVNPTGFTPS
jgi:hypothetical protein